MFRGLCEQIPRDPDVPDRARRLDILRRVLDGTIYDTLPYSFHEERGAGGEYVPLRLRRPSVRYAVARVVVEDSVALLFSEGHFPRFSSPDPAVSEALAAVAAEAGLNGVMIEAAIQGSVGSVAIAMRVLGGRVFFDVLDAAWITPEWDAGAPDTLVAATQRYKVPGAELAAAGYAVEEPGAAYWFQRRWDREAETWFVPQRVGSPEVMRPDASRTVRHGLGFVPLAWIKNLPGGVAPDGACTFRAAVETGIEIDYQLSQAGRGLKYSSDPTLLIKEPAGIEGELVRGAANALIVSEKGDARLLEINGTASAAVLDYVRLLRELALESVHGNRSDASRLAAAPSGRALELMSQGLMWLADNLRISYGEGGLLKLGRMVLRAAGRFPLTAAGRALPALDAEAPLALAWPRWFPETSEDRAREAQTLATLKGAGHISQRAALRHVADSYGIADLADEQARINAEQTDTT